MEFEAKIADNPICIKFFKIFLVKKIIFGIKLECRIVWAFIWCRYCVCKSKNCEYAPFLLKKLEKFFSSNGATLAGSNENFMEDMVNFKTHIGT